MTSVGVACILCTGTDYAADCADGQCAAEQLDLIEHPVDALKAMAERVGLPLSPEAEAEARKRCEELWSPEQLADMAAAIRRATSGDR